jgi:glutamate-1-semialdehyde 2,1-aminomutase
MAEDTMKNKTPHNQNESLFNCAKKHLVGGVNSPVRSFDYVGGDPLLIKKGKGSRIYDYNDNAYIDYVLSFGAMILGHAHPTIVESLTKSIGQGFSFGATNLSEVRLANIIKTAIPFLEKIRFVNSGTEAVMGAVRLARGCTGRTKIVKFKNAYHGHADYLLAKAGSGLASLGIPISKGVPKEFIKHTIVLDYGDKKLIDKVFNKYGSQIAAVIVEPVGGNYGVVAPDQEFLKHLRKITKQHKTQLIFDEIITGFRFDFGSVAKKLDIKPDLICLGKIIGGGLPIGAYGGPAKIMDNLSPLGEVYQASTFGGNPFVMQAGIATLEVLLASRGKYKALENLTERLSKNIEKEARSSHIDLKVTYYGTMFSFKFAKKSDFRLFYKELLKKGIYFAPSEYEANFLSFFHTQQDIEETTGAVKEAFKTITNKRHPIKRNKQDV